MSDLSISLSDNCSLFLSHLHLFSWSIFPMLNYKACVDMIIASCMKEQALYQVYTVCLFMFKHILLYKTVNCMLYCSIHKLEYFLTRTNSTVYPDSMHMHTIDKLTVTALQLNSLNLGRAEYLPAIETEQILKTIEALIRCVKIHSAFSCSSLDQRRYDGSDIVIQCTVATKFGLTSFEIFPLHLQ